MILKKVSLSDEEIRYLINDLEIFRKVYWEWARDKSTREDTKKECKEKHKLVLGLLRKLK